MHPLRRIAAVVVSLVVAGQPALACCGTAVDVTGLASLNKAAELTAPSLGSSETNSRPTPHVAHGSAMGQQGNRSSDAPVQRAHCGDAVDAKSRSVESVDEVETSCQCADDCASMAVPSTADLLAAVYRPVPPEPAILPDRVVPHLAAPVRLRTNRLLPQPSVPPPRDTPVALKKRLRI